MKELSIEEKAKRYDEAIDKIADAVKADTIERGLAEWLFPELKESEDERIRKELIDIVKKSPITFAFEDKGKVLAWLEKQGEQKPILDFKAADWYVSKVDGKIHNIYQSVDKIEPKFKVKYAGSEYNVFEIKDIAGVTYYGIEDEPNHIDYVLPDNCEIVFEQNPAWSEEDEERIEFIIALCADKQDECAIYSTMYRECNETKDWLISLKDRVQSQYKQEWSEEDEIGLGNAFIKKAKKWFEKQPELYDANGIRCYSMEDFDDFKNYMEG